MRRDRPGITTVAMFAWLLGCAGCVIRTSEAERYVGPVFLRATDVCWNDATIVETLHVGVVAEIGTQVGIAAGAARHLAVAARDDAPKEPPCERWTVIAPIPGPMESGRWLLSPLYAARNVAREPEFVARTLIGAQAAVGTELSALSLGVGSRTDVRPRDDRVYSLSYDARRPMETRFRTWRYDAADEGVTDRIIREVHDDGRRP